MARILVLFATIDGQTARIAGRMADVLRADGHEVVTRPARVGHAADDASTFDGVIVGGGIRYGSYAKYLAPMVARSVTGLSVPTAFFSVCLSAGGPGAKLTTAQGYVDAFLRDAQWRPDQVESFAGALLYRRYNPLLRLVMRFISSVAGGETDTSRNYEYTDWDAVARFARDFGARAAAREGAAIPAAA